MLREDVVRILLKSFQSARYFLEVSFRRLCTFALKRTTQAEVAVIGLFDALSTKEPRLGSDRKTIDTQINSDGLASGRADGNSARHHQVQPEFPLTVQQLSTLLLPLGAQVLLIVRRDFDSERSTIASLSRLLHMHERDETARPIKAKGPRIVADSTQARTRAAQISCEGR